jgi:hypothetical protein
MVAAGPREQRRWVFNVAKARAREGGENKTGLRK